MNNSESSFIVEMKGIVKIFPGVRALSSVDPARMVESMTTTLRSLGHVAVGIALNTSVDQTCLECVFRHADVLQDL